jgi:hypothetical protein
MILCLRIGQFNGDKVLKILLPSLRLVLGNTAVKEHK